MGLVKEEAMASEAVAQATDGRVGDLELARDLPESGAGHEALEDGAEEFRAAKPVAGGESGGTESTPTV